MVQNMRELMNIFEKGDAVEMTEYLEENSIDLSQKEKINYFSAVNTYFYYHLSKEKDLDLKDIYENNFSEISRGRNFIECILNYFAYDSNKLPTCNKDIHKAIKYIEENLSGDLKLQILADYIHISKNYFCNLFKECTGLSFNTYVNKRRSEMAKNLLTQTEFSIENIAFKCGYNSTTHFCTTFKKFTGRTPVEYRKLNTH
ncbi:MAG: AraC family transcriptional regulator [Tissierellia bacterium]|nr:AraC family transcriptional regulator [Tissierellia bacterium]